MGWMSVEQTMATMGGMIDIINTISPVQRSWSRAPPDLAASPQTVCSPLAELFGSTAAVGREAFVDAKKPCYTACDYMLGLTCQLRGSIGQRGITIHRDGRHGRRDRPSRRSGPRIGEDGLGEKCS